METIIIKKIVGYFYKIAIIAIIVTGPFTLKLDSDRPSDWWIRIPTHPPFFE